jgi:hypothetical protein
MKLMPKTTFFVTGLALWALGGCMISMGCFEPTVAMDQLQTNKELAKGVGDAWQSMMMKVSGLWALAGGTLGLLIFFLFSIRPSHEHYTRLPMASGMPGMYGASSGPRTMAELKVGFQSWILGTAIGLCGVIFLLPHLQSELIVVRQSSGLLIFSGFMSFITTVPILPFSLKRLSKAYARGCRE